MVDGAGSVYVSDWDNNTIRKMTPVGTNWAVTTLAGLTGHPGSAEKYLGVGWFKTLAINPLQRNGSTSGFLTLKPFLLALP